jgi:hypothetical protein
VLAHVAVSNTVHEEVNNECLKDSFMIYVDERIYNDKVDLDITTCQIFGNTLHSVFSALIEKGIVLTYQRMMGPRFRQEK